MNCIQQESGKNWTIFNGDCCEVIKGIPDNSIDFCVHSPPFSTLYIYSESESDMGNCASNEEFIQHYEFLIGELYRVTVPGRLCAIHVKDLPLYLNRDGESGLQDFPGMCVEAFQAHGWTFHSRVTIWKCPVTERERTNNHGLLHKTVLRDTSGVRQGMADFLLVLRKPAGGKLLSDKPVERPKGFQRYVGDPRFSPLTSDYHPSPYARTGKPDLVMVEGSDVDGKPSYIPDPVQSSIVVWRRYAEPVWWDLPGVDAQTRRAVQVLINSGFTRQEIDSIFGISETDAVWFDIDQTDVLNFKAGRSEKDEKHICPLQMGVIERAIELWTNPGDVVLTPFAGIGSEVVGALRQGRKGIGIELKDSYFKTACQNCRIEESHIDAPRLDLESALPSCDEADEADTLSEISL